MTAWEWLKRELIRRLGEAEAEALWREYWHLNALDNERRKVAREKFKMANRKRNYTRDEVS